MSNFNIQRAARNRLRKGKGDPTPPNRSGSYRPSGEVTPGHGVGHGAGTGRHWSGERQMARENAMSRKWSRYKNSGHGR